MYVKITDLPQTLRNALAKVGYRRVDVRVEAREDYVMNAGGSGQGRRTFVVAVDLATGASERRDGSWGGANMFNPQNGVDLDRQSKSLPPNFAVIYGSDGDGVCVSSVHVNPATLNPLLPAAPPEMPEGEQAVLCMYAGLNSRGRADCVENWQRAAHTERGVFHAQVARDRLTRDIEALTVSLIARGYVKRNKAGAVTVTTEGLNAYAPMRGKYLFSSLDSYFPKVEEKNEETNAISEAVQKLE